ncbi:Cysteine dioxygenase [Cercospora zeina]
MSTTARRSSSSSAGSVKPASLHDSARGSPEPQHLRQHSFDHEDDFQLLVQEINRILGPSNGIDSASVRVGDLVSAMESYLSDEAEWSKYAFSDAQAAYTRNLVDRGNGKANLLILVWTPGKASPVHDHADAHCVMKVLKGTLEETLYGFPCQANSSPSLAEVKSAQAAALNGNTEHICSATCPRASSTNKLPVMRRTRYTADQVTYMSDRLGLHSVGNPSTDPEDFAISLHLYTPPNAASSGCHTYDPNTGKKSSEKHKMNHFYSELGVKM